MSCDFLNHGVGTEKWKAVNIEDLNREDTLDEEWLPVGAEHSESMQGKQQEPVKTSSKTDVSWLRRRATSGPHCQRSTSACWRGQKPQKPTVLTGQQNSRMQPISTFMSQVDPSFLQEDPHVGLIELVAALPTPSTLQHHCLIKHFWSSRRGHWNR